MARMDSTRFAVRAHELINAYKDALTHARGANTREVRAAHKNLIDFLAHIEGILINVVTVIEDLKNDLKKKENTLDHQRLH